MSTERPPTAAERLAAQQGRSAAVPLQVAVLVLGLAAASVMASVLSTVTEQSNPLWVLIVVPAGMICFIGLLLTSTWSVKAVLNGSRTPLVTHGIYLTALLLTAGIVVVVRDGPALARTILFALAVVAAALTVTMRLRQRSRAGRTERLRSGARTTGTVTDDGLADMPTTPNIKHVMVTVSFHDHAGVERWLTAAAVQSPARPITAGDHADIWFDASNPGEISRIVVQLDNGASRLLPNPLRRKRPGQT